MKRLCDPALFKRVALVAIAALALGACQKSKSNDPEKSEDVVVLNEDGQTLRKIQGSWKIDNVAAAAQADLPVVYALTVNGATLSVVQFDRRTLTVSSQAIGTLTILQENMGEVNIDPAAYLAWTRPKVLDTCGPKNTECLKDHEFTVREAIENDLPSWSLRNGRLSFTGLLADLGAEKVSAAKLEKIRKRYEKAGKETLSLLRRALATSPQGVLTLKRTLVKVNGQTTTHLPGSGITYACGGREVVIPENLNSIALTTEPRITLNGEVSAPLQFRTDSMPLSFWNPYRCGDRACSRVSVDLGENEISLTETIDDCVTTTNVFGN